LRQANKKLKKDIAMDALKSHFTKQAFKNGFTTIKAAFNGFMNDLALKYSASLAITPFFPWHHFYCWSYRWRANF
jgi:hypothetical protein